MADKINVLIPEETVDAKIKEIGEQIQQRLCRKRSSPHLYFKGRCIFCLRISKENYSSGFSGLYAGIQLWRCDREFGNRSY